MATPTTQDFIKVQIYTTDYVISITLLFLNFLLFAYSASHSYYHILPSIRFTIRHTYNLVYPNINWLRYLFTTMAMTLYNLGRESDEVIAKRFSNQLKKARRHNEKQVAAKPMSSISMTLISIELMFRQTGANDLIQGNSVGCGIAKMLKYAMYRHFIFVWALQQARIKSRSSRAARNKSIGTPPVPYELFLYPRDRDAAKPHRTSRFKTMKDNVFKFFKLAYPKVLALLCQCIQVVKETLIEDWNILVSFLVSTRRLTCDIASIILENCKRTMTLAYTDCVTHVHVIWDNAAMIWKQILSCVEVGISSIISDLMVLYEMFVKMPIDVTNKFLAIVFSTTIYLRIWIDEDMAIVFTARVFILGNRRPVSLSLFGVHPWVRLLFTVVELVRDGLRKAMGHLWNQLDAIIRDVKKSLAYSLELIVRLGEKININGMVVLYYFNTYLDMIKTKTTNTVHLSTHWLYSAVLDVIRVFGRLYAHISITSQIYATSIVQLNYRVFSKSQLEAERLRNMFDDYKTIVEQMVDRYTHLNSHRLVATQAALSSVSSQYTRLRSELSVAHRHSEELSDELMNAKFDLNSYSLENKSLRNDVSVCEQEVFEIKQQNSTLVRQVEELEGRNWGLSVKHTQERATLQRQIKEQAEISASQEACIGTVERERDEINHLLDEERIAHVHTTGQLENIKAKLAKSREECEHLLNEFDQDKAIINALKVQLEEEQHSQSRDLAKAHEENEELRRQLSELGTEKEVTLSELESRVAYVQEQLTEETKGKDTVVAELVGCKINEVHLRNQVEMLEKELEETKTQNKVVNVMKDAELEDLRRLVDGVTNELMDSQVKLCIRSGTAFELEMKVKALELDNVAANDVIQLLESRIASMGDSSCNDLTLIGDELYGDDKISPVSVSFSEDLFSRSIECPTIRIIRTIPATLSECLDFGVDDMLPTTIACSDSLLFDADCDAVIRLGHISDEVVSHTPFTPRDGGLVEAENCNGDYGLFSTSLILEDVYDDGVLPSVNLASMYKTSDVVVTCDDFGVDEELLPVTVTVDEKLLFGMDYFVAVHIGHGTAMQGSGYTDIGISVADEVEDFSDDMLMTTSVNVPPYLYWFTDALPVVNIGGTQRRSTLDPSVSLDSLARIWTTGSVNVDVCYTIQALDLAMTRVRVPFVDENTEDWGDVVSDSGIFMVDEGDHLPTSITCPGWLYARSTDVQLSRTGRVRAYSVSRVGERLVPPDLGVLAANDTILAFDFPDNMPHGCILPDELLLASCL